MRYAYSWEGERIFKIVSFYLFRYLSGRLGDATPEHAHEVAETRWLPLAEAPKHAHLWRRARHGARALEGFGRRGFSMIRPPL